MENITIAILIYALSFLSNDKRIYYIIASGCIAGAAIDYMIDDIAIYYAVSSLVLCLLAYVAIIKCKSKSSIFYAILMIIQSLFCFLLVPEWSYMVNYALQLGLTYFNDGIELVLLGIGIISSDGILACFCNCDNIYSNVYNDRRDSNY
jgi:hypothetical protein